MIGVKTSIVVFVAVILGIAGLCAFVVFYRPSEECAKEVNCENRLEYTVAEGMRMWNPKTGVDSFRFDACRVEKMRWGVFHLGWFDVLCLEGLVLNLPLQEGTGNGEQGMGNGERGTGNGERGTVNGERGTVNGMTEVFAKLLPRSLLESAGVAGRNFAGIKIKGLAVNKVENRLELPVFAADEAMNQGRTLKLLNCRVFESGRTNLVGLAFILLHPAPVLVWKDGKRELDDLFPNFAEMKGKGR